MSYKSKIIILTAFMLVVAAKAQAQGVDLFTPPAQKEGAKVEVMEAKEALKPDVALEAAEQKVADELGLDENLPETLSGEVLSSEVVEVEKPTEINVEAIDVDESIKAVVEENAMAEEIVSEAMIAAEASLPEEIDEKALEEKLIKEYDKSVDEEIFTKMTDIERESALLTLQLRKEKIKNDIDSVKKQRELAEIQEKERVQAIEDKRRAVIEEEKRKMVVEQQKLKEQEIAYEKLRQEKLLASYKEKTLEEKQEWIAKNKDLYKKIKETKEGNAKILEEAKAKMSSLLASLESAKNEAVEVKGKNDKKLADLKTQIAVLQSQLNALNPENPFDGKDVSNLDSVERLDKVYAIMEVRGKGDKLIAKLLNKDGQSFLAQVGTELQTGHVVDEITETYLRGDIAGKKDYIYFAAGGILKKEPKTGEEEAAVVAEPKIGKKGFAIYNP